MTGAVLMRGLTAIGEHLGIAPGHADHLDRQRHLPTFRVPGDNSPHATAGGLDEWRQLPSSAALIGCVVTSTASDDHLVSVRQDVLEAIGVEVLHLKGILQVVRDQLNADSPASDALGGAVYLTAHLSEQIDNLFD